MEYLDLGLAGLEAVQKEYLAGNKTAALEALLAYYKKKAQTGPALGAKVTASEQDFTVARDAAKNIFHILRDASSYPPYDYGPDIDWDLDPFGDIEWPAGMHRFVYWDGALANCYQATGDEAYARTWLRLVDDWIEKNPLTLARLPFPHSWDAIQVGIRCERMARLFLIFIKSPAFTAELLARYLTSIYNHARRIMQMPYLKNGNFAMIESRGFAALAKIFPEFKESAQWENHIARRMEEIMVEQVMPDGVQGELCPNYHLLVAQLYLDFIDLFGKENLSAGLLAGINRMMEHCLAIKLPDDTMFWVGDTSSSTSLAPALAKAGRLLDRPDFLAAGSAGKDGTFSEKLNYCFPDGGFYTFRNSWDPSAIWLGLHCGGPTMQGPDSFHSQFDRGTFELMAYGRKLMTDPGVYSYQKGTPGRELFRSTAMHQTLTVDGKNTQKAGEMVLWSDKGHLDYVFVTVKNEAYPGFWHVRTLYFVKERFFVLVDQGLGQAEGNHDLHFQLVPGPYQLDPVNKRAHTDFATGGNILVATAKDAPVDLEEEEAWFAAKWHEKTKLPAFRLRHHSRTAPSSFVTLLYPYEGSTVPEVELELVRSSDHELNLVISHAGDETKISHVLARQAGQ